MSRTIGLNTLFLIPNAVGGTENYTRTFIDELEANDTTNRYIVFCNQENFSTFSFSNPRFHKVLCPVFAGNRVSRIFYEQTIFPWVLHSYGCDVIHSFGYIGPIISDAKKIVTVHDANWKDHPEDQSKTAWIIVSVIMKFVVRSADVIVCDSTFSRSRLIHFFPQMQSKIHVILPWVGESLLHEFGKRHESPLPNKDYILCVSGMYPHKRISYLLDLAKGYELVLIGKNGIDEPRIQKKVKALQHIHYFPKVSLEKLASFYQHATLFVFPSVYEGFGYPVYEAAAVGVPTIVGKKDLYEKEVSSHLQELTFDLTEDKRMLREAIGNSAHRRPLIFSKKQSINRLIELYTAV